MKNYKHYLIILISFVTYSTLFAQSSKNNQKGAWKTIPLPDNFDSRIGASTAWTGSEFILWRGSNTLNTAATRRVPDGEGRRIGGLGFCYTDGWLINPKTGKVRKMAPVSFPVTISARSVWTGKYLFVRNGRYNAMKLYNPATNTWKNVSLQGAPLDRRINYAMIWTGKEVLIWGGSNYAGTIKMNTGYLYNPETNRWRRMAPSILSARKRPSCVVTNKEVIIWGTYTGKKMDGAAFNFTTNQWRKIADCPFRQPRLQTVPYIVHEWTGKECLFFGGNSVAYNPTTNQWRDLQLPYADLTMLLSNYNTWDGRRMYSTENIWDYKTGKVSQFPKRAHAPAGNAVNLMVWLKGLNVLFALADDRKTAYVFDFKATYTPPVFKTKFGKYTDPRDKQTYKTVTIGNQTWMAENLRYNTPESKVFGDKVENMRYGKMYAAKTAASACPPGWRLPDVKDFRKLLENMGGEVYAFSHLFPSNSAINKVKGTGKSGLNLELAGYFDYRDYESLGKYLKIWAKPVSYISVSPEDYGHKITAFGFLMVHSTGISQSWTIGKKERYYIRCIKK